VPGRGDWPTNGHDAGRSGTATDESQLGAANVASLGLAWSTHLDGKVTAQPLFLSGVQVAGATHDVVIAATNQNTVYALDAVTGAVLWRDHLAAAPDSCGVPGGFGITGTPVVDRTAGRIYAVTDDGALRTLSLADGTQQAAALPLVANPATNNVWGGLTLVDGEVYFPTASNGCDQVPWQGGIFEVAVTASAPQLVAHFITVPSLPASTAGGGIWGYGGVSFDASTGHVYAASSDDGTGLNGDEGYTPYAGSLLALSGGLGLIGWYQPPQPKNYNCGAAPPCDQDFAATPLPFHPPACPTMLAAGNKNGKLYVTSESNLEANNGTDGSHVQAIPLNVTFDDLGEGGLFGTPLYDPTTNLVYVSDTGPGLNGVAGGLVALAVQPDCSLAVAWSQPIGSAISDSPNSMPTLANGVVYVGVNDGSVSAFDAASGTPLWNSGSRGSAVYAAPIVANGRLVAASWDGAGATDAGSVSSWLPTGPGPAATVPGAPGSVDAVAGNQSATVTWSAANDGGSPITAYTVTPFVGSVAQPITTVTGNPLPTTAAVSGLTNGTTYTFTVTARNAVGAGPPSSPSPPVTPVASAGPAIDAEVSVNATRTTATTSPFSAHAGDTLVAFVASDGPQSASSQTSKVSGAGLTWTLVTRANGQYGTAEVWTASAAQALSGVTVSARSAKTGYAQQLTVIAFQGSGGIGASRAASALSGPPTVTLTTTHSGSLVYAVGDDWDAAIARTVGVNQTIVAQWVDTSVGDTFWVQSQNAPVNASGTVVTSNDTLPTGDRWNLAAVEIKSP
jgi:outer membrane protein assembly factor BamB